MVVGAVKVAALSPAQQILTCGRSPVLKVEAAQLSTHWIISKSAEYRPLLLLSRRRCPPPLASVSEEPTPAAQQSGILSSALLHVITSFSSSSVLYRNSACLFKKNASAVGFLQFGKFGVVKNTGIVKQ
ncbi:hypothetical protein L7F22_001085 [Adiantum nelumboides]|nr:hypothetical protein [Adiantum nelumboides]